MRSPISVVVLACLLTAGCSDDGPIDSEDIDRDGWQAALSDIGYAGADVDGLEDVTRDQCEDDIDSLALFLTLQGSDADLIRTNFEYVCPSEVENVDTALEQIQDTSREVDEACATDPNLRTEDQQMLSEVMGC